MNGLAATSVAYLEDLHRRYRNDPASVDFSWRCVFDLAYELAGQGRPEAKRPEAATQADPVRLVIEIIRQRGHLAAPLDPLRPASDGGSLLYANLHAADSPERDVEALLRRYRSPITIETAHIDDAGIRRWLHEAFEALPEPAAADLRGALDGLIRAEEFEAFLGRKYPTKKRFGMEGAETTVTLLESILRRAALDGIDDVVIGSMHRGRLNLMANVFGKPLTQVFAEFKGAHPFPGDAPRAADVPYHLGTEGEVKLAGRKLRITVLPNPSHLEAIDPVVLGRVRARQDERAEAEAGRVLGLILHTDAAVVGQGIVAETLQLSAVPGFSVLGTIHVVVNNQIGFTTEPWEARTSRYCTGPWKAIDAPIIHVSGDDPQACMQAAELAVAYRQTHARDVVIDLVCHRRNGHNELDEPRFTQPLAYLAIDRALPVRTSFERRLVAAKVVAEGYAAERMSAYRDRLQQAFEAASGWRPNRSALPTGRWSAYEWNAAAEAEPQTGVDLARLKALLAALARIPEDMRPHPKVERLVSQRIEAMERGVAWSLAEALAFASLVTEGVPVRLVGQDAMRGTFSSRHFGIVDTRSGKRVSTIDALEPGQARFTVLNSPLSEYAVLGFEYGYSLERPDALVVWEAQFGDFANGAQIMIDQFIASGEEKWLQRSGLVMLVPHGLEGQGPEHSSARPERYLQLAARGNIEIANPSTPANCFHLLRRQSLRRIRKPLVVLAPKSLLRLPAALSRLEDLAAPGRFRPVLSTPAATRVRRILFCTGKIAYELEAERARRGADDTLIVRLERIYPLPADELAGLLASWPDAAVAWVQEEPENMGVWPWIETRLTALAHGAGCRAARIEYRGRPESASPAGSFHGDHEADQATVVAAAFAVGDP